MTAAIIKDTENVESERKRMREVCIWYVLCNCICMSRTYTHNYSSFFLWIAKEQINGVAKTKITAHTYIYWEFTRVILTAQKHCKQFTRKKNSTNSSRSYRKKKKNHTHFYFVAWTAIVISFAFRWTALFFDFVAFFWHNCFTFSITRNKYFNAKIWDNFFFLFDPFVVFVVLRIP